jgi:hypothetical protein
VRLVFDHFRVRADSIGGGNTSLGNWKAYGLVPQKLDYHYNEGAKSLISFRKKLFNQRCTKRLIHIISQGLQKTFPDCKVANIN